jgi:flagellar biosynthetic protein FlhB
LSEDSDRSQKTEEATPRKLLEAREKGQVMTSQEVSHLAVMIGGALIAGFLGPLLSI